MNRVRPLDGIRGLAVLAVVGSHTFGWLSGGALGVDMFFVLSGFLITSLLVAEHERTGQVDYLAFYRRRAYRLGPALLIALAIAVPLIYGPLSGELSVARPVAIIAVLLYVANWVSLAHPNGMGPLDHTWSLSIEEQFYLLWPAGLALLFRRGTAPSRIVTGLLVGAGGVAVLRAGLWGATGDIGWYYATITRADDLLIGCAMAITARLLPARLPRVPAAAAWASAVGLGALMLATNRLSPVLFYGGFTLAALLSAALIAHSIKEPASSASRALSWSPLVYVGRISYGLYLYHFMIFQWVHTTSLSPLGQHVVEYVLSAVIAVASFHLVERPLLRRSHARAASRAAPPVTRADDESRAQTASLGR
jgi:peptidoglycan/LPS O-acetylase OafA/YrhL